MAFADSQFRSMRSAGASSAADVRSFLNRVFLWMTAGLAITGATSLWVVSTPAVMMAVLQNRLVFYGLMIAELVMVMAFSAVVRRAGAMAAAGMFLAYAFLNGLTLSIIFLVYTSGSLASTFFITAGTFGAMSVFGAVTKRDLSSWGSFLFMGLIGVVLASVVNIFIGSSMLSWVMSCAGVLVFTGLTAYDTQRIAAMAYEGGNADGSPAAINGALRLYLDFINLFLSLLRLFGDRR